MVKRVTTAAKLYYRIGEVAELVGVQTHVLRYWESEFGSIRPQKSASGQRVYSHKDLERLQRVKRLLHDEGYTIAGARKKVRAAASPQATSPSKVPTQEVAARPVSSEALLVDLCELRDMISAELLALEASSSKT